MTNTKHFSGEVWTSANRKYHSGNGWRTLNSGSVESSVPTPALHIPLGYKPPVFASTTRAPVMSSPPSITDFGPMNATTKASPLGVDYTRVLYNDTRFRPIGVHTELRPNGPLVGVRSKLTVNGAAPFAHEFYLSNASRFVFHLGEANSQRQWWMFVDGEPISQYPQTYASTIAWNATHSVMIDFGTVATRKIRLEMAGPCFAGIDVDTSATVTATSVKRRIGVYGDSWVEGASYGDAPVESKLLHMPWMMGRALDADVYISGWGGTGYTNGTGATPPRHYGAATRLDQWIGLTLDEFLIFGTINDGQGTGVEVRDKATEMYADLATRMPSTKLIIVGVESYASSQNVIAVSPAVDWQIKQAALLSPNVIAFVSPREEAWVTGSGNTVTPKGDGTADIYHNGNNIAHLSLLGNRYYGEKLATVVAALVPA